MYSPAGSSQLAYFFQAIAIYVSHHGSYVLNSNARFSAYLYLYRGQFDPNNPSLNLLTQSDDQGAILNYLVSDETYTLVVTTVNIHVTGLFSITVYGILPITVVRMNITSTRGRYKSNVRSLQYLF